jgi:hypothetical protein
MTKGNKQAKQPPALDIAKDVEFDDLGGLRTRYPYADLGVNIFGGGTLSNIRRIVPNGNELLCFTQDTLYSWNAQLSVWVSKGTHLAVKVAEEPVFVTTGEQYDCDRAELNGTIVYCWTENVGSSSRGYVAAVDKTTGSVLMAPTALVSATARLRVTSLSTKILLSFYNTAGGVNELRAYALDPASPATALAGASTALMGANFNAYYDIVRIASTDQAAFVCRRLVTTSYEVGTVTAGLTVATSTKARICSGPIACSVDPTGTYIQVARMNGTSTNLEGDLLNASTLADVYTAQVIVVTPGTLANIACAHRSVQNGGAYRCYVFCDYGFGAANKIRTNWVSTANTLGTDSDFLVGKVGIASRAFDYDGSVYVNVTFFGESAYVAAQLQNAYFLYRDDGFLAAKMLNARAGGSSLTTSRLPGVASTATGVYEWCGMERRIIPLGIEQDGYADRGPNDLTITFDSNEARRCARLGRTLYITGGEVLQYDGARLTEVGFHYYPFLFTATDSGAGTGLANGDYAYKVTYRWQNAQGETERSTTASIETMTVAGGPHDVSVQDLSTLTVTHKTANPVSIELWRTAVNPTDDAPYYLASDNDPTNVSTTNGYLANDTTTSALYHSSVYTDALADASLTDNESNPENGGYLESLAPPAATIITASSTRIFLAGVAGDPDRVWYSKQRQNGEVAAFHDALTVDIPPAGGDITALAIAKDGTPVVFRESAIYVLLNDGFDNASGGQNYVAREASSEYGAVSAEAVVVTDRGMLFKSTRGWCSLNLAFQADYVGAPVSDYDSEDVVAAHVTRSQQQIRVLTSSRALVFDALVNQWAEWTLASGATACVWNDQHVYATSSAVKYQRTDYTGVDYGFDVETAWIKVNDLQGRGIVRAIETLGEYRGAHSLRVRLARNYQSDGAGGWSYFQDKTWAVTPTVVGGAEQLKLRRASSGQSRQSRFA